jgi:hypothetical protein
LLITIIFINIYKTICIIYTCMQVKKSCAGGVIALFITCKPFPQPLNMWKSLILKKSYRTNLKAFDGGALLSGSCFRIRYFLKRILTATQMPSMGRQVAISVLTAISCALVHVWQWPGTASQVDIRARVTNSGSGKNKFPPKENIHRKIRFISAEGMH